MNLSLREMQEELSVGEEFVTRYNRPGPRYTSYPTAPVWSDAYGPNDFEAAMQTAEKKRSPVSQFHWGGGTPTYLSPEQIEDLFLYTRERPTLPPAAQIGWRRAHRPNSGA